MRLTDLKRELVIEADGVVNVAGEISLASNQEKKPVCDMLNYSISACMLYCKYEVVERKVGTTNQEHCYS